MINTHTGHDRDLIPEHILTLAKINSVEHANLMARLDILDLRIELILAKLDCRRPIAPAPIAE